MEPTTEEEDQSTHKRQRSNDSKASLVSKTSLITPSASEELGITPHEVALELMSRTDHAHLSISCEPSRPNTRPNSAQRSNRRPASPTTRPGSSKRPTSPSTRIDIQKINTANLNKNKSMESIVSETDSSQLINLLDEFLSNSPSNKKNGSILTPSKMKMDFDSGKKEEEIQPETIKHIERFIMLLIKALQVQLIKELCKRVASYRKDGKECTEKGILGSVASLAQRNSLVQRLSVSNRPQTLLESLPQKKRSTQNSSGLRLSQLPEGDEDKLLTTRTFKEPSLLSIPSIADIEEDEDEYSEEDKIAQLKQYILKLAQSGPSVYHSLAKHADSVRQANLPEDDHEKIEMHLKRFRNAFAVIAVEDATAKLEEILSLPPLYPLWVTITLSGIISGGICGLFFSGGWDDVLVGGFLGAAIAGVGRVVQRPFDKTFEFLAAVVVSAVVRVLIYLGIPLCYASTTISAVLPLLQGTALTMAMIELATRNMVPGTTRLFAGLTMTTLIGFGMEFGLEVVSGVLHIQKRPGDISNPNLDSAFIPNECVPLHVSWHWVLYPITAIAQCLNMNAHVRQIPGMLMASLIAYVVRNHLAIKLNQQIAIALSAFCCGCFSNVYGRLRGVPAMIPTYAGMLMLVPGSMALRSITELIGSDPTKGVSLVVSVLSISLAIGLGLFLSATIVVPLQDWADHFKGKHTRVDDLENLRF
ncbi:UNVERIFIED_CONTAM: hypothetical protein HDU68_008062 [Siphonaria sp. JEL0065]|nr:hypothetical protein HDU68_008062 [Siphonaria sp. JEL0065]